MIAAEGPLPLSRFMALCLSHPRYGYYMTRDPLGEAGDFVTAPEVHQIFGDLIGAWAAATWAAMGSPARVLLVECGPGRGTLMADILRAARSITGFRAAIEVHLVETSPVLRAIQARTLGAATPRWHEGIDSLPDGPVILVANEFLDALPIRQWVATPEGWRERVVGVIDGKLTFGVARDPLPPSLQPKAPPLPGMVMEWCPALAPFIAALGQRKGPLAALFIDYGQDGDGTGDTLQAVAKHAPTDPLSRPGEVDLTAHVSFSNLREAAHEAGLAASELLTQRDLLFRLGIVARAETLARTDPRGLPNLTAAVERLIDPAPTGMGALFKAMTVASPTLTVPAFDTAPRSRNGFAP